MAERMHGPELYVVVAATGDGSDLARLTDVLAMAPLACVLIAGADGVSAPTAATAMPLIELAQAHGVATLVWQDASLARTLRADGVHLPFSRTLAADFATAREILDQRAIVGADAGRSRHDAMAMGEAGASYVSFGAPEELKDQDKARERRLEHVSWWGEIFEVPCVAFDVADVAAAMALADAGADFVAAEVRTDEDVARFAAIVAALGAGDAGA